MQCDPEYSSSIFLKVSKFIIVLDWIRPTAGTTKKLTHQELKLYFQSSLIWCVTVFYLLWLSLKRYPREWISADLNFWNKYLSCLVFCAMSLLKAFTFLFTLRVVLKWSCHIKDISLENVTSLTKSRVSRGSAGSSNSISLALKRDRIFQKMKIFVCARTSDNMCSANSSASVLFCHFAKWDWSSLSSLQLLLNALHDWALGDSGLLLIIFSFRKEKLRPSLERFCRYSFSALEFCCISLLTKPPALWKHWAFL